MRPATTGSDRMNRRRADATSFRKICCARCAISDYRTRIVFRELRPAVALTPAKSARLDALDDVQCRGDQTQVGDGDAINVRALWNSDHPGVLLNGTVRVLPEDPPHGLVVGSPKCRRGAATTDRLDPPQAVTVWCRTSGEPSLQWLLSRRRHLDDPKVPIDPHLIRSQSHRQGGYRRPAIEVLKPPGRVLRQVHGMMHARSLPGLADDLSDTRSRHPCRHRDAPKALARKEALDDLGRGDFGGFAHAPSVRMASTSQPRTLSRPRGPCSGSWVFGHRTGDRHPRSGIGELRVRRPLMSGREEGRPCDALSPTRLGLPGGPLR